MIQSLQEAPSGGQRTQARRRRDCPVCGAGAERADIFIERRIDANRLTASSFASRKVPEFMNHRLVRCRTCDLVYVDEPPSQIELAKAYRGADYDSGPEADDAAATYIAGLSPLLSALPRRDRALEIGAGTGTFLEKLVAAGFSEVVGVEPSPAAIAAAPAHRRKWIAEGIFEESAFEPSSFDLICCFMTMEHVRDPDVVASAAYRLLRRGGAFAVVVHDYRGLVNRLLGTRSPIVDVQHMQLFSRTSIARLFVARGYSNVAIASFANCYRMSYWLRLTPLPAFAKAAALKALKFGGIAERRFAFDVGNLLVYGIRP
jgi:SAM-dependent methyltransferase